MEVVITDWALQSYLELMGTFTQAEYWETIRPDAVTLMSKMMKKRIFVRCRN